MRISATQLAAAMSLCRWTQEDLAKAADVWRPTISKILTEKHVAQDDTLAKLQRALELRGIEFIANRGVQWRQHEVQTLSGVEGLKQFFDDVRATVAISNEEIVICGIEEDYIEEKLGEYAAEQRQHMTNIASKVKMRCLIKEGDPNVSASEYCQYRWQPKDRFAHVPFYVYGDKLAIIATSGPDDPQILIIQNRTIVQAYRLQFEDVWNASHEIHTGKSKK